MLTLVRAKSVRGALGDPIPAVFNTLANESVHIRRGQLTLIAAAPGVGKSVMGLTVALRSGIPAFYVSADTDPFTMYLRAGSMLTGWTSAELETAVKRGHTEQTDAVLGQHQHIRWDFNSHVEPEELERRLKAYVMAYGEFPHLIVVDNLKNLEMDGSDSFAQWDAGCDYLHDLAKHTSAAVVALHHVTGAYQDGVTPVPLKGLLGQIGKTPEVILTLYKDQGIGVKGFGSMLVCPVKNRGGKAEADASWSLPLYYEPARTRLEDYQQ